VHAELALRRLRIRLVAVAAVLVLLLGAGWAIQHLRVTHAREILSGAQAETQRLGAEVDELAPVSVFVSTVGQRKALVSKTMADEVAVSKVVGDLRSVAPPGARLDSVAITVTPAVAGAAPGDGAAAPAAGLTESACPGPDPFDTLTVVGCITLSGSAVSRATVGDFVIALGEDDLFVEPFISTTTTGEGTEVTFTGSVGLSRRVYTQRYADIDALLAGGAGHETAQENGQENGP
jgi:hypothetical protein